MIRIEKERVIIQDYPEINNDIILFTANEQQLAMINPENVIAIMLHHDKHTSSTPGL